MHSYRRLLSFVFLVTYVDVVNGFYVPGVAPRDYTKGEDVDIKVHLFINALNISVFKHVLYTNRVQTLG